MPISQSDINHVLELERELQSPATRRNVDRLRELLARDFIEVGASGKRWDLTTILGLLSDESNQPDSTAIGRGNLTARPLIPDLIQVFWDSARDGWRARRTLLWRRTGTDWEQVYHQETVLP